jgi:hypothetical protein
MPAKKMLNLYRDVDVAAYEAAREVAVDEVEEDDPAEGRIVRELCEAYVGYRFTPEDVDAGEEVAP